MRTTVAGVKRFLGWSLLATVSLLVVLLGWNLYSLQTNLARLEEATLAKVLALGESARAELARRDYRAPSETAAPQLRPDRDPSGTLFPRQLALKLGKRTLWAIPPHDTPSTAEPPPGVAQADASGSSQWTYTYRVSDGRLFIAVFDAPAYGRTRSRMALLAGFEVVGAGVLALFWGLLAYRLYTSYREVEAAARQAGDLLRADAGPAPQDVVAVFQRTVSELRTRTAELERMGADQKRRAEDVEAVAGALSANLAAGYLRFGADGALADTNADARLFLGLANVPRKGETAAQALADYPELLALLEEARESRSLAAREELEGGGGRLLQAVAIPLFNQLNQARGVLLVLRDQTEVYRMARTLREREALSRLGEVAAGVAHEVRNGLNVLTLQLKNLEADHGALASDPRLGALRSEIGQLGQVVNELLFFAKPLRLEKAPEPAQELLESAATRLRGLFPDLAVEVRCEEGLSVECDSEPLGRALTNLARNAGEAASAAHPGAGRVLISARVQGGAVELRIEDDGSGVAADQREAIFAPFATQKPGGTGLGLPIARKVAREHGGDLVAVDAQTLPGAAFLLTLPA